MSRLLLPARWIASSLLVSLVALGCDDGSIGVGDIGVGDGGLQPDVLGPACTDNSTCNGGVCVGERCCASAERVCGQSCCALSTTCFANACVTPGNACFSQGDCADGQYCEPSLGTGGANADAGAPPDGGSGGVCLQPAPIGGRCLELPARCAEGVDAGAGCLPACEYTPDFDQLNAAVEWRWGPDTVEEFPAFVDLWSSPVVGRVTDSNCDGKLNELDPPNIIFVSGNAKGNCCHCTGDAVSTCQTGVLRAIDGASGKEVWSLRKASADSVGFASVSVALGDIDRDGRLEVIALTGEGRVVMVDGSGKVVRTSDTAVANNNQPQFGWGGGLAIADMDGDGAPEIAFGAEVFTTSGGAIKHLFSGKAGGGGGYNKALSTFADLDGKADGQLELVTGKAAYRRDGSTLYDRTDLKDGFPGVGDFNGDGKPEVVLVQGGKLWVLRGLDGATLAGPFTLTGAGSGGPPTVADFDGDGQPEIGVAKQDYYSVVDVDLAAKTITQVWAQTNHDFSSSVTGSTVFDFEGDGSAEVIYGDECFLWVYDGKTGKVRFATPTTSFTGTEASLVADVDGDGRAEMVMIANGADPTKWKCDIAPWTQPDPSINRPAWKPPAGQKAHRGITVWGDRANGWVGTRTLWNQHTYHVSNICDARDSACSGADNTYGAIPRRETANWSLPWLNNFRQNVQDRGLFDAPDATVTLRVDCTSPVGLRATLRNLGLALLPKGIEVAFFVQHAAAAPVELGRAKTKSALFPGQAEDVVYQTKAADGVASSDSFVARIVVDPKNPTFYECRDDNNESAPATNACVLK